MMKRLGRGRSNSPELREATKQWFDNWVRMLFFFRVLFLGDGGLCVYTGGFLWSP